jgi:EAL domain-containing protein (putative c-di-GMP-specific phosphodiesterase class I)
MELAGTKITTTEGCEPDLNAVGRITTADVLVNRYKSKWILDAMNAETYESWYQPIVAATSSKESPDVFAHEALFRMSDEFGSIVPPSMVFQIAEDSDLLFSLDLKARRSAVESAYKANLKGKIFINFNPTSIYDPSYCLRTTAAAINELGLQPSDVVFEITETHKVTDLNHLKGILAFYRNAGFGVALDDIGSGWSGLNLLHEVRPDYIKIDMELIRDIEQHTFKQTIVKHLIEMAKSLSIRVIAEGVETEAEYQWIQNSGVDYVQGYYFSKPDKPENLPDYSRRSKPAFC